MTARFDTTTIVGVGLLGGSLGLALKARGLRFVGPTTAYALMQSAGLVDDHLKGCWRATP